MLKNKIEYLIAYLLFFSSFGARGGGEELNIIFTRMFDDNFGVL